MEALERFERLFTGYSKRYGRYNIKPIPGELKKGGAARTVDAPPTSEHYAAHLNGEYGIGIIPLTDDNKTFFCALDVDVYDGLDVAHYVRELVNEPVVITLSKSGGMHIWLFCNPAVDSDLSRSYMKALAGRIGFGASELFPKQTERANADDVGNWINLPYFGGQRVGMAVINENDDVGEITLEQFLTLAEACAARATDEHLRAALPRQQKRSKNYSKDLDFKDGPVCLQRIWEKMGGPEEGARNTAFFNAGVYIHRKTQNLDETRAELLSKNAKLEGDDGLKMTEIDAIISSLKKKPDYGYQCSTEPLCTFCDRAECRTRKFGIGTSMKDYDFEIEGWTKILTDPVSYAFTVNGKRVFFENSDQLFNQKIFNARIFDAISEVYQSQSQAQFVEQIGRLAVNETVVEPPPGDDEASMLRLHLANYVEQYKTPDKLRLRSGSVWIKDGEVFFILERFRHWLLRESGPRTKKAIGLMIKDHLGGENRRVKIGESQMSLMCVSALELDIDAQAYEDSVPDPEGEAPPF